MRARLKDARAAIPELVKLELIHEPEFSGAHKTHLNRLLRHDGQRRLERGEARDKH